MTYDYYYSSKTKVNITKILDSKTVSSSFSNPLCDEYFYSSERLAFTNYIYLTFQAVFWLHNLLLIYIRYNDIPSISRYLIEQHKPTLRFRKDIVHEIIDGTVKHQIILTFFLPLLYR